MSMCRPLAQPICKANPLRYWNRLTRDELEHARQVLNLPPLQPVSNMFTRSVEKMKAEHKAAQMARAAAASKHEEMKQQIKAASTAKVTQWLSNATDVAEAPFIDSASTAKPLKIRKKRSRMTPIEIFRAQQQETMRLEAEYEKSEVCRREAKTQAKAKNTQAAAPSKIAEMAQGFLLAPGVDVIDKRAEVHDTTHDKAKDLEIDHATYAKLLESRAFTPDKRAEAEALAADRLDKYEMPKSVLKKSLGQVEASSAVKSKKRVSFNTQDHVRTFEEDAPIPSKASSLNYKLEYSAVIPWSYLNKGGKMDPWAPHLDKFMPKNRLRDSVKPSSGFDVSVQSKAQTKQSSSESSKYSRRAASETGTQEIQKDIRFDISKYLPSHYYLTHPRPF